VGTEPLEKITGAWSITVVDNVEWCGIGAASTTSNVFRDHIWMIFL
jgi:hypothetical protein